MRKIKLSCGVEITLWPSSDPNDSTHQFNGEIKSNWRDGLIPVGEEPLNSAFNAIESLILACACEGIDISTPAFECAIETSLEAIVNNLS